MQASICWSTLQTPTQLRSDQVKTRNLELKGGGRNQSTWAITGRLPGTQQQKAATENSAGKQIQDSIEVRYAMQAFQAVC